MGFIGKPKDYIGGFLFLYLFIDNKKSIGGRDREGMGPCMQPVNREIGHAVASRD